MGICLGNWRGWGCRSWLIAPHPSCPHLAPFSQGRTTSHLRVWTQHNRSSISLPQHTQIHTERSLPTVASCHGWLGKKTHPDPKGWLRTMGRGILESREPPAHAEGGWVPPLPHTAGTPSLQGGLWLEESQALWDLRAEQGTLLLETWTLAGVIDGDVTNNFGTFLSCFLNLPLSSPCQIRSLDSFASCGSQPFSNYQV